MLNFFSLLRQPKNRALLWLLGFAFAQGVGDGFVADGSEGQRLYSLICIIANTILVVRWFVLDAREQNYRFSKPMFLGLVAFALGVAPIYFFLTRGQRCWRPILGALLFLCVLGAAILLGQEVAYQIALARFRAAL